MAALSAPTMDFSGSANAPVYAEDAASAQNAYNQAQTTILARRGQLNNQAGFLSNADGSAGGVDGNNLVGGYQQLQKAQGQQLEAQHEADMSRNIGTAGIGQQNTSNLRYGDQVGQANFANSFLNANQTLNDAGTGAFNTYQQTLINLQLQAIADATKNQTFPTMATAASSGAGDAGDPTGPSAAATATAFRTNTSAPQNANAKSIHVGSTSDVNPALIALAAKAAAAAKKASGVTKPISGYAQTSNAHLH